MEQLCWYVRKRRGARSDGLRAGQRLRLQSDCAAAHDGHWPAAAASSQCMIVMTPTQRRGGGCDEGGGTRSAQAALAP
jgi:hypothetical protein